jgi:hypothetical protein
MKEMFSFNVLEWKRNESRIWKEKGSSGEP